MSLEPSAVVSIASQKMLKLVSMLSLKNTQTKGPERIHNVVWRFCL